MAKLHIVNPYNSIAMLRMTAPLMQSDALPKLYSVTTGPMVDPEADINYHVPWHTMVNAERGTSKHVILYTHCNPPDVAALLDACERADNVICMSFKGRSELVEIGVDPAKLWVIYAGCDTFAFRRRNIGIIASDQPNGRKRLHLLVDLVWQMDKSDLSALNFVLAGNGLEPYAKQMQAAGANVELFTELSDEGLQSMYSQLDALLVTGYAEGGPLTFMEAYACGVPVYSPEIGYAADFSDAEHTYTDIKDLADKLHKLAAPAMQNSRLASALGWSQYVYEHALVFGRLMGQSVELQDGADRYVQLLDIVRESKARRIVEIGTWNGARAVQMIQEAAKTHPMRDVEYIGFDLFEQQTGEMHRKEFSKTAWPADLVRRRIRATKCMKAIIPGPTSKTLKMMAVRGDLYFIDGGHSIETIASDWAEIEKYMTDESIAVFDDYYHGDHPAGIGCNITIDNLSPVLWEVTHLPVITKTAGLQIGMVKVRKRNADVSLFGRNTPARDNSFDLRMHFTGSMSRVFSGDVPLPAKSESELGRSTPTP